MHFVISSDSCLDRLKADINKDNINVLPMTVIAENSTFKDDFNDIEQYQQFYKKIGNGEIFKTASLNEVELTEHFEQLLKQKKDIIHFSLSSGLSLTYDVAKQVAEKLNAKNNNKIYLVDTKSATQGQNLLVSYGVKLRDMGVFGHEAYQKIMQAAKKLYVLFFVTDFDCLKRGGRINAAQAVMGKLVGVRPIIGFDADGKLKVVGKVIGNKKALQALASKLENYDDSLNLPIYIAHTGNLDVADELQQEIVKLYPEAKIVKNYIGPTIGAHAGKGALGLVFLSKKENA